MERQTSFKRQDIESRDSSTLLLLSPSNPLVCFCDQVSDTYTLG